MADSPHRPDLLLYSEAPEPGGVTAVLEALITDLAGRYAITLVLRPLPLLLQWSATLAARGVRVVPLALRNRADLGGWLEVGGLLRLYRVLRRADLLHVHQHTPFSCLPALRLAGMAGTRRRIATEHYISSLRFLRRRPLSPPLAMLRNIRIGVQMFLKRLSLRGLDRVILVSESNRRFLMSVFPRECRGKTEVIANGIDTARYLQASEPGAQRLRLLTGTSATKTVLVVAGLNNQKGHRYLFQSVPAVVRRVPGTFFVLVGDGHLRPELERLAAHLGISGSVCFAGRRDDVPELLAACDLVVLPSLFEGMPLSVLEAMAARRAVVATRVDGTSEIVEDGRTGLLVPPADPQALGDAIVALLTDDVLRRELGTRGRMRAAAAFDRRTMTERYTSLYATLLPGNDATDHAHRPL